MERTIYSVLVDDDKDYSTDFIGLARSRNIHITHFDNLQKAKEELPGLNNLDFIIFDGKCLTNEDDTKPDFDFVLEAQIAMSELEGILRRYIPHCLNTGYIGDEQLARYKKDMAVFEKVTDQEKLFKYIEEIVISDEGYQIKNEHKEVFDIFDNRLLSSHLKGELIQIFKEVNQNNPAEYKSTLRRMRPFIEAVFIKLYEADSYLIPKGLFKKGAPNISGIIFQLAGKPRFNKDKNEMEFLAERIFPPHIYDSLDTLFDITSEVAMHHYDQDFTSYLVKSCLFALLEFLLWFKNFYLKNNY